ncbi:heptaprenyl diphosphate synthase [Sporobacter termitidis DSM 10068]|uniref:Heptaprenyl diphosphate synthase n=1 Tax=Sporobacter termitidis DSM 10068 TaxID=1123282 RepID=A0A1M5XQV5_9FIRM|nr:Gx transporter family protein [Sporobacter termitidis]SHI02225.1 heptaprenyl diphosphate synthase [Sporobacter termitidis DSM 10068]
MWLQNKKLFRRPDPGPARFTGGKARAPKTPDVRGLALTALLFALSVVLALVESALPVPPGLPGVRLGLSNIVVMYALFFLRRRDAFVIAVLKAAFVLLTRGAVAGLLSLAGGLSSLGVMTLFILLCRRKSEQLPVSVAGAVFHNLGQLAVASAVLGVALWYYLPVLLLSGAAAGCATALLLRFSLPALARLNINKIH